MKKKIYFLSVSRSDFDRYYSIIDALNKINKSINTVLVSGSHYSKTFGYTFKEIKKSGFRYIKATNSNYITNKNNYSKNILKIISHLSKILSAHKPDLMVVLGDRYEMISGPLSCLDKNIPVVHIHGGAVTMGAIDDNIRHAITKFSHIHYVSHNKYLKRVLQLGEEKWRVKNLGAPGLDLIKEKGNKNFSKIEIIQRKKIKKKDYILICLNPETRALDNIRKTTKQLLNFIKNQKEYKIFTYPNSDPGCDIIISSFKNYIKSNKNSVLVKNFNDDSFYPILKNCKYLIGNSSVGIVEAATFNIPVINIGDRQKGKILPTNVVNAKFVIKSINNAYKKIYSKSFLSKIKIFKNPYGDGRSGIKIAKELLKIKIDHKLMNKKFIDK